MKTYADTSFLFSLYATDVNSIRADTWRQANPAPLPFTTFHRLELVERQLQKLRSNAP